MNKRHKIKITVMKKVFHSDLVEQLSDTPQTWRDNSLGPNPKCCHSLKIGQEFISDGTHMPKGFPDPAWVDINKYVYMLSRGGNMLGSKQGVTMTNCTDGFRPVTFKLERLQC